MTKVSKELLRNYIPDNWGFNGVGLFFILPCGKTKIYNIVNQLENNQKRK